MPRGKTTAPKGKNSKAAPAKGKVPPKSAAKEKVPPKSAAKEKKTKDSDTLILVLTQDQLDDFLGEFVCSVSVKQARTKLLSLKGKADKPASKEAPVADEKLSLVDLSKLSAKDLETMAQKKAKKEKTTVPISGKGKSPTKKDNLNYLTDAGDSSSESEKPKKTNKKANKNKNKKTKKEETESDSSEATLTSDSDISVSSVGSTSDSSDVDSEQSISSGSDSDSD